MLGWVQGAEPLARVRSGEHGHVISGSLIERYGELKRQALDCVLLMGHPRLPSVDGGNMGGVSTGFWGFVRRCTLSTPSASLHVRCLLCIEKRPEALPGVACSFRARWGSNPVGDALERRCVR